MLELLSDFMRLQTKDQKRTNIVIDRHMSIEMEQ